MKTISIRGRMSATVAACVLLSAAAPAAVAAQVAAPNNAVAPQTTGTLIICKAWSTPNHPGPGVTIHYVNPFKGFTMTSPIVGCSHPQAVPPGTYTMIEQLPPGTHLTACSSTPAGTQISYDPANWSSTVSVHAGTTTTATFTDAVGEGGADSGNRSH